MSNNKKIQDATIRLLKKDEFYANIIFTMDKVYNDAIGTLGVGFKNNKLTLFISPKFFNDKSLEFQEEVLIHECEHIIKGHLLEYRNKGYDKTTYNIAADIQINERLTTLHEIGATADRYKFEKNLLSDQYYRLLQEQKEEEKDDKCPNCGHDDEKDQGDNDDTNSNKDTDNSTSSNCCSNCGQPKGLDNHDMWDKVSNEIAQGEIQSSIEKAINNTKNKGNIPSSAMETLEMIRKKADIPWRRDLNRYVGKLANVESRTTRMRKNRRFGYQYAGTKTENNKLNIAICLDTSGSVSSELLQEFFKEIDVIHNQGHKCTIIECDADVHVVKEYKPKSAFEVTGRGGTMYQPALDKSKQLGVDLILFFGDGGCFDSPVDVKIPTMWILGPNDTIDCDFGRKVNLTEVG